MSDQKPLQTDLAGISLAAPIILAAGTAGIIDEFDDLIDLSRIGAIVTKSITPSSRDGNKTWRIIDVGHAGMMNAIGLANPGIEVFCEKYLPRAKGLSCKVFVSVAGFSIGDYVQCVSKIAEAVSAAGGPSAANVPCVELNVSCPNVKTGTEFGHTPALISELLGAVKPVAGQLKVLAKLSPATPHLVDVARAAVQAGVDGLTLGNTYPAMAIDVEKRMPRLANGTGGMSGPGLHPIALKHVFDVYSKVTRVSGTPIVALGGVMTWEHAAAFVLAGAKAVQMGTSLFVDPRSPMKVQAGLSKWVQRQGRANIATLVGDLQEHHTDVM